MPFNSSLRFASCAIALCLPMVLGQGDTSHYPDGNFTYPDRFAIKYQEGSTINVTWTSVYRNMNLFYSRYGDDANSKAIASNLQAYWFSWTVATSYTNLSIPMHFHVVDADGSGDDQLDGGFWSQGFYILADGAASTQSAPPSYATTAATASASSSVIRAGPTGNPRSMNAPASTNAPVSANAPTSTSVSYSASTPPSDAGLSTGAKAGIGAGIGIGIPLLAFIGIGAFCLGKRAKSKQPAELPSNQSAPAYSKVEDGYHNHGYYHSRANELHDKPQIFEAHDRSQDVHELPARGTVPSI